MCLTCKEGIKIATKNFKVYKNVYEKTYEKNLWSPPIFNAFGPYEFNKLIVAEKREDIGGWLDKHYVNNPIEHLEIKNNVTSNYIENGFHAYLDKGRRETHRKICIIPIGAEYCIGYDREIVSNQIIVFRNRWEYFKWLIEEKIKRVRT